MGNKIMVKRTRYLLNGLLLLSIPFSTVEGMENSSSDLIKSFGSLFSTSKNSLKTSNSRQSLYCHESDFEGASQSPTPKAPKFIHLENAPFEEKKIRDKVLEPPQYPNLTKKAFDDLILKATKGDKEAIEIFVDRYYWRCLGHEMDNQNVLTILDLLTNEDFFEKQVFSPQGAPYWNLFFRTGNIDLFPKLISYIEKQAQKYDEPTALHMCGLLNFDKRYKGGKSKDSLDIAIDFFKKSADHGYAKALREYAQICKKTSSTFDTYAYVYYLKASATQGYNIAKIDLANHYWGKKYLSSLEWVFKSDGHGLKPEITAALQSQFQHQQLPKVYYDPTGIQQKIISFYNKLYVPTSIDLSTSQEPNNFYQHHYTSTKLWLTTLHELISMLQGSKAGFMIPYNGFSELSSHDFEKQTLPHYFHEWQHGNTRYLSIGTDHEGLIKKMLLEKSLYETSQKDLSSLAEVAKDAWDQEMKSYWHLEGKIKLVNKNNPALNSLGIISHENHTLLMQQEHAMELARQRHDKFSSQTSLLQETRGNFMTTFLEGDASRRTKQLIEAWPFVG